MRGQSGPGQTEEPRLLLVFAGAEARARGGDRRSRRHAEDRGGGRDRSRGRPQARHSRDRARRRDRELRPSDAADRRRPSQPDRDEQDSRGRARARGGGAGRAAHRHRQDGGRLRTGTADVSLDPGDRVDRRLHRRRLGRRRLDHLGGPARLRQRPPAARPDHGGRAARAGTHRRRSPQGGARLWHQWGHHRSRNAADARLTTGSMSSSASTRSTRRPPTPMRSASRTAF